MATTRTTQRSARRDEVLDGLVALFLAEGFRSFSIEDWAGRLQCSKSTLYLVAASKEQLITAAVRAFFRRATDRVEARVAEESDPIGRIGTYLEAISTELAPASARFFADASSIVIARPGRAIALSTMNASPLRALRISAGVFGAGSGCHARNASKSPAHTVACGTGSALSKRNFAGPILQPGNVNAIDASCAVHSPRFSTI